MVIIVGLGNPGRKYEQTRHNAGFMVIDELSKKYGIKIDKEECKGLTGRGEIEGQKVMLVKPQTYMNLSGECISELLHFYKISEEELIVIYDDIDIALGKVRVKPKGNPGSHNGMKNIVELLNTKEFIRVRIGTDKPPIGLALVDYVLMKLSKEEKEVLKQGIEKGVLAIEEILKNGCYSAMNLYNGEPKLEEEGKESK